MDRLLAKLAEQEAILQQQQDSLAAGDGARLTMPPPPKDRAYSSEGSVPVTPATGSYAGTDLSGEAEVKEMLRLKRELEEAKSKIARMDRELSQTRITKHSIDQVLASPSEPEFRKPVPVSDQTIGNLQGMLNATTRTTRPPPLQDSWGMYRDAPADPIVAAAPYGNNGNKGLGIWGHPPTSGTHLGSTLGNGGGVALHGRDSTNVWADNPPRMPLNHGAGPGMLPRQPLPPMMTTQPRQQMTALVNGPAFGGDGRGTMTGTMTGMTAMKNINNNGFGPYPAGQGSRRLLPPSGRGGSMFNDNINHQRNMGWGMASSDMGYPDNMGPTSPLWPPSSQSMVAHASAYQGLPVSTPLSPTAPEFTAVAPHYGGAWSNAVGDPIVSPSIVCVFAADADQNVSPVSTYVSPIEPLNYRRLLDRTVNCDWKYIVDKIVCNNDQQASIFLQQKLKMGTPEQKFEIIEAIVAQAYPLMVNRFGNFLIQRCFEHGTPEQVVGIANAIRGNTLNLSMDSFGCHVVQKAFDCVPEDYKAVMVHELLRRIPETVIHRYACHVWQKLFELRWTGSPPQIMKYVNEALRGMWHEVALGETGSLVVQNIFENCLDEDKVSFPVTCLRCSTTCS